MFPQSPFTTTFGKCWKCFWFN